MFRQLAVKGVLPGLAMMMIYYCAASGIEDLGHQMFHVVCSSMMMMLKKIKPKISELSAPTQNSFSSKLCTKYDLHPRVVPHRVIDQPNQ